KHDDLGSFLERPPLELHGNSRLSGSVSRTEVDLSFLTPSEQPGCLGTLGPYEVKSVIGRGGMGIVFRARDPRLNRVVAIKVLAPELAAQPTARQRFLREAQAAAAISHPHVVTIHAVEDHAGEAKPALPFLVMECIVGQTLQQKLDRQGSLRVTEIVRISHQIAEGLAAAHRRGLIHRDIKPANILLENGIERVRITDFGLARAVDDATITRTGEVSGTPQYMSPEQAGGERVDHRSDLFSLGCVMYAMCTGRSPFRATSLAAAIKRVCQDDARPIAEINPEIPAWLVQFIDALLQKDPQQRPQSTSDVAEMLEAELKALQMPEHVAASHARRSAWNPVVERNLGSDHAQATVIGDAAMRGSAEHRPTWLKVLVAIAVVAFGVPLLLAGLSFGMYLLWGARIGAAESLIILALMSFPVATFVVLYYAGTSILKKERELPVWYPIVCVLLAGPFGILLFLYLYYVVQQRGVEQRDSPVISSGPVAEQAELSRNDGPTRQVRRESFRKWGVMIQGLGLTLFALTLAAIVLVSTDNVQLPEAMSRSLPQVVAIVVGVAVVVTLIGGITYEFGRPPGSGTGPIIWFLLLGPLGLAIWLARRERQQEAGTNQSLGG
ncbi:MAG: serine/threonine protein kinase, partial [Planctomycetaceae bacterium]|nr:serine/threonine protein kinase [Planctomycetaceae bacterium]